ncbi:hypothetical protein D3C78_421260 [compost metagenome]
MHRSHRQQCLPKHRYEQARQVEQVQPQRCIGVEPLVARLLVFIARRHGEQAGIVVDLAYLQASQVDVQRFSDSLVATVELDSRSRPLRQALGQQGKEAASVPLTDKPSEECTVARALQTNGQCSV